MFTQILVLTAATAFTSVESVKAKAIDAFVFTRVWQAANCRNESWAICSDPGEFMRTHLTFGKLEPYQTPETKQTAHEVICNPYHYGWFFPYEVEKAGRDQLIKYWPYGTDTLENMWISGQGNYSKNPENECSGMFKDETLVTAINMTQNSSTPTSLQSNIGGQACTAELREEVKGLLQCKGDVLTHVVTCWDRDLTTQIECPPEIQTRDSCSSEQVKVLGFEQPAETFGSALKIHSEV